MYKNIMKVYVEGQGELELYTIGYTAKLLKKSVETIRAWERQKIIPTPMYKSGLVRLYHPMEVDTMRRVLRKLGKQPRKKDIKAAMYKELKATRREILYGPEQEQEQKEAQN